jgi:hypothetical protein
MLRPSSLTFSLSLFALATACTDPALDDDGASEAGSGSSSDTTADAATGDDPPDPGASSSATTGESTGDPTTGDLTTGVTGSTTGDDDPGPAQWDGPALPNSTPGFWKWVDFPGALCRDGSSTGLWLRRGTTDKLVIFFDGGGACFNPLTCANNLASYDHSEHGPPSSSGIFTEDSAVNPVGDWHIIFVPYCTGDVHAGDRPDQVVDGVDGTQQFVGYRNGAEFLERIVPTWPHLSHVLVTGSSAGGFGAGVQYDRIVRAFPKAKVTLLDDSGPPLPPGVLAPCLQQRWADLWGFEDVMPKGCPDCLPAQGGGMANLARYLAEAHPDQRLGLISSTADATIRFFFGYGADECTPEFIDIPAIAFEAGLVDLREQYLQSTPGVWGTFLIDGSTDHVWLAGKSNLLIQVDGVSLVEWLDRLLDGEATHLGP